MKATLKKISYAAVPVILSLIAIWCVVPKPELIVSILVRMLACGGAIYVSVRYREWKILFLAAMFFLMAVRQVLTFLIWTHVIERSALTWALSELPGFVVTLLSLVSIIYIGFMLSGKVKLIERQDDELKNLNRLLPICSKCRKIRDDEGYWSELETYIESHTDSQFSHGLCEKCSDELYGGQPWYEKGKAKRKKGNSNC